VNGPSNLKWIVSKDSVCAVQARMGHFGHFSKVPNSGALFQARSNAPSPDPQKSILSPVSEPLRSKLAILDENTRFRPSKTRFFWTFCPI
jgi:hypothetical protein